MSKHLYTDETIVQYLLGSLPEAQTEQLDELSVTDDSFANALRAAENGLVDAYIQGELAGTEEERFKTYYLSSPRRRQQLEFARALKAFGERHIVTEAVESQPLGSSTKDVPSGLLAKLPTFTSTGWAFQWGLAAAALALFIIGGWLVLQNIRLRQQMSQAQARRESPSQREQELETQLSTERSARQDTEKELARVREELARLGKEKEAGQPPATVNPPVSVASFILTPQTRAIGQIKTISIPQGTRDVAVQLELEAIDYTLYRVSLKGGANKRVLWTSKSLKAFSNGQSKALSIRLPATLLRPQVYVFELSGVRAPGAAEVVGSYSFKVNGW